NYNVPKKNYYEILINNEKYYIKKNDKNIINPSFLNIYIPNKLRNKNIKIKKIEIKPLYNGHSYRISYTYEVKKPIKSLSEEKIIDDWVSIDLGMKNLMTIYDPTGLQKIIKG